MKVIDRLLNLSGITEVREMMENNHGQCKCGDNCKCGTQSKPKLSPGQALMVTVLMILIFVLSAFVIQVLWNTVGVSVFKGLSSITLLQAMGLKLLIEFLF